MNLARKARARSENFRVLHYDKANGFYQVVPTKEIHKIIPTGSLLVVNDAATFPARLKAYREINNEIVELRFFPFLKTDNEVQAFIFNSYGWNLPTEERRTPAGLKVGEKIKVVSSLLAMEIKEIRGRLLTLSLHTSPNDLLSILYEKGHLIQYSYHEKRLELYEAQTLYATQPLAAEMPSAGYFMSSEIISNLKSSGIELATLTHQTGLSSSGDAETDAHLPMPEYYCVPQETIKRIHEKKRSGNKIIAVGTSVVRALESIPIQPEEENSCKRTSLILTGEHQNKWVDGIISGLHTEGESHFRLLEAFVSRDSLKKLLAFAEEKNLLSHEYGDICLII